MNEQERIRQIPLIVMLLAAAVTAVISLFSEITFGVFLLRVFVSSVVFYVVGLIAQILFAYALKTEDKKDDETQEAESDEQDEAASGSGGEYSDEDEDEAF